MHHALGNMIKLHDGLCDPVGNKPDNDSPCQRAQNSHISQETIGHLCTLPNTLNGRAHDKGNSRVQPSIHFQIFIFSCHSLQHIVLALLYHLHRIHIKAEYISYQLGLQLSSAVLGTVFCLRIGIHHTDGNIIASADRIQLSSEFLRVVGVAVCGPANGHIRLLDDIYLAPDIIILQKNIVDDPAKKNGTCHQSNKDQCKLPPD